MKCFVCDEPSPYPVCNSCTREGFDINKIFSGEQKPKFNHSDYKHFIFKETIWYDCFTRNKEHANRIVDLSMLTKRKLELQTQNKLGK